MGERDGGEKRPISEAGRREKCSLRDAPEMREKRETRG
jgi:hypothetical protein